MLNFIMWRWIIFMQFSPGQHNRSGAFDKDDISSAAPPEGGPGECPRGAEHQGLLAAAAMRTLLPARTTEHHWSLRCGAPRGLCRTGGGGGPAAVRRCTALPQPYSALTRAYCVSRRRAPVLFSPPGRGDSHSESVGQSPRCENGRFLQT